MSNNKTSLKQVLRLPSAAHGSWLAKRRAWFLVITKNEERRTKNHQRLSAEDGIALVLVLGVLSLMLILGVAFAISMRTERLAAGNYADSVRARQLAHVGLVRAMNDVAMNLGTNGLMSQGGGTSYPPWTVTNSYSTNWTKLNTNTLLRLGIGASDSATNFIPRALWAAATNADYGQPLNNNGPSNHWIEIRATNIVGKATNGVDDVIQTNLIGRVSYLIVNCSGLLDANFAGGVGITRQSGTNPSEIELSALGEIGSVVNADTFLNTRDNNADRNVRYETLPELKEKNFSGNWFPSNLFFYSYFSTGSWDLVNGNFKANTVNLKGSSADLITRQSEIISAFTNAGFAPATAGILYNNLIDYVDVNDDPANPAVGSEAVPMINEIVLDSTSESLGPGSVRMHNRVRFELWYPFVSGVGTGSLSVQLSFPGSTCSALNPPASNISLSAGSFGIITFEQTEDVAAVPGPYTFRLSSVTLNNSAGNVADSLNLTPPVDFQVTPDGASVVRECIDPRFNYTMATDWSNVVASTLGTTNNATKNWWAVYTNFDTSSSMYVANSNLCSVGELRYLAYGTWQTVKLVGAYPDKVLDVFALGTGTFVTVRRGLVNPNSEALDALAAVFSGMPIDNYPGGASASDYLCPASGRVLAEYLYANRFYTNLSDIGRAFVNISQLTNTTGGIIAVDNDFKRESLIRNACGLLSVRQNLFTILIEAQVASGGNIPRNAARQRAVAVVWRDPYTGEFIVHSVQWLED